MDIDQLRLFAIVARTGSMTRASIEMNITQSAVSQSIAKLENEIGVELFTREKRRIKLKESGERFYKHITRILHELDDACLEANESGTEVSGVLRLQVFAASALMPQLLAEFSMLHPKVRYRMIQYNLNSDFDLCIDYVSRSGMPSGAELLLDEEVMLAVPRAHHLAVRDSVRLDELKNDSFILMRTGTVLRKLTDMVCQQAGFVPRVVFESDNPAAVRSMITMGLGVAFLPIVSWHSVVDENIALLHISEPRVRRQLCIYPWQGQSNSVIVNTFRKYAVSYFGKIQLKVMSELSDLT